MATILITGCDKGLGREFARQYANDGHRVFAICLDPAAATETAAIGAARSTCLVSTAAARRSN